MSDHLENQEKSAKSEAVVDQLSQEAVHDAFGKSGNEGSFKSEANAANSSAKKALPDFEITNDTQVEKSKQGALGDKEAMKELEELRKDSNGRGGGGGGKIEANSESSRQGALGDKEAMKELEELRKDPNGKGGGGRVEKGDMQKGLASSGGARLGDELQKGGPNGGSSINRLDNGEEMPKSGSGGGGFKGGKYEEGTSQSGREKANPNAEPKDIGPKEQSAVKEKMKGLLPGEKINKKPVIEQKVVK